MARPPKGLDEDGAPLIGDALLRNLLKFIDEDGGMVVTRWEADFLENVLFRYQSGPLSDRQRLVAQEIIWKYAPDDASEFKIHKPPEHKRGAKPGERRARHRISHDRSVEREGTGKAPKPW